MPVYAASAYNPAPLNAEPANSITEAMRDGPHADTACAVLEARALECVRGERMLFSGLNFVLPERAMLQVVGRNGAGKTSLLRMLCGLAAPAAGEIHWRGRNIVHARREFLSDVAYHGHAPGIKSELTPYENLRIAQRLSATHDELSIDAALAAVGLRGMEDLPARRLSAGQLRRVALARLLMTAARLWILDEPLTSLDEAGREIIEATVNRHLARGGSVVLSTHQPLKVSDGRVMTLQMNQEQFDHD